MFLLEVKYVYKVTSRRLELCNYDQTDDPDRKLTLECQSKTWEQLSINLTEF